MALEGKQFSHYRILRLIGQGGMGEVYLAEDVEILRQVAVKFIRIEDVQGDQVSTTEALRLFLREAIAIARLDHPNILPLYDHGGTTLDGAQFAYLIIPYRPEGSLTAWLRQRAQAAQTRQLTLKQVAHIVQQAATALQYAHDHQVMHLDVKPANFLIRSRAGVDDYPDLVLSDFGIARLVNTTSNMSQNMRGTPTYMAPEQWASQPTFASDQYALAIMAYELLTGRPPFLGMPLSVMYAHVHEQPGLARDFNPLLPPDIDLVLQHALAKKPEARFSSVTAFAQAFQTAALQPGEASARTLAAISDVDITLNRADASPDSVSPQAVLSDAAAFSATTRTMQEALPRSPYTPVLPPTRPSILVTDPPSSLAGSSTRRSPLFVIIPILLSLLLIAGGATGVYRAITGRWPGQNAPGTVWHSNVITPPVFLNNIVWSNNQFVAVGNNDTLLTSSDGNHWAIRYPGSHVNLRSIAWSGTEYVVVGEYNTILTSRDGLNWSVLPRTRSANPNFIVYVAWLGTEFVIVGDKGLLLTSSDGMNWTVQQSNIEYELWGVTWSEQSHLLAAVGSNGSIVTSPDGKVWTPWASGTQSLLSSIAWSGTRFVAVGFNGTLVTSLDGRAWRTEAATGVPTLKLYRVAWTGTQFVIVGENGLLLTSSDGINWTIQTTTTSELLSGIASSGQQYVVVGDKGTILTSP